jgi:hypothetical protein
MRGLSIQSMVEDLKSKLTEGSILSNEVSGKRKCVFKEPGDAEALDMVIAETGWHIPEDFKHFLLMHNGADFFTNEYGPAFQIFSIEELRFNFELMVLTLTHVSLSAAEYLRNHCFPIGYLTDVGPIVMDYSKLGNQGSEHILIIGAEIKDLNCDFKTWLDRMIRVQGDMYWEWNAETVLLD